MGFGITKLFPARSHSEQIKVLFHLIISLVAALLWLK